MHFMWRRPVNSHSNDALTHQSHACAHLSHLFNQCKQINDASEQDQMFYELLPLFYGVLSDCEPVAFVERFSEVHAFCARASQLLVKEIKQRAAHQTSEEGSRLISIYLDPVTYEQALLPAASPNIVHPLNVEDRGWNLLCCLNLLSTGHMSLIECMIAASVPSTLIKCLYIFLDLPHDETKIKPPVFSGLFKQLIQRLAMFPVATDELVRKDALCHLFSASSDWCPSHNIIWRTTIVSVLSTIAQNGLTSAAVKYIHESKCIADFLKNVSQGRLAPLEMVDGFASVLHVLNESTNVSYILLEDFRTSNGYAKIIELVLRLELDLDDAEAKSAMQTMISLVERLVVCGAVELRPKPGAGEQIHMLDGFHVPKPLSAAGKSVRNMLAFDVLQSLFLSSSTPDLALAVLGSVNSIYAQDPANYFILEHQNTLGLFAKKIYQKTPDVQEAFFGLLELLVNKLHYVPMKEISSIVVLLKTCSFDSCMCITLRHLVCLLRDHKPFKEVYHDVGLLELAMEFFRRFVDCFGKQNGQHPESSAFYDIGMLLMDFFRLCVTGSVPNTNLCLRLGFSEYLIKLLQSTFSTPHALRWRRSSLALLEGVMLTNGGEEVMPNLLAKMHVTFIDMKIELLLSFCRVLRASHLCRIAFRKTSGFVYTMQELISLEGFLSNYGQRNSDSSVPDAVPSQVASTYIKTFRLIRAVFSTMCIAMKFEPANAYYFATEIGYTNLTNAVIALGSFNTGPGSAISYFCEAEDHPGLDSPGQNTVGLALFKWLFRNPQETEKVIFTEVIDRMIPVQNLRSVLCQISSESVNQKPLDIQSCGDIPRWLFENSLLARYMYDLAIDAFETRPQTTDNPSDSEAADCKNLAEPQGRTLACPFIIHPEALTCLLQLSAVLEPAQTSSVDGAIQEPPAIVVDFQLCLLDVLISLTQLERNQQLLCSVSILSDLIKYFKRHLASEFSPLHNRVQTLYECLAAHSVCPSDLREFFRLCSPLCCSSPDLVLPSDSSTASSTEIEQAFANAKSRTGGPLSLCQIKCLISTLTPMCTRLARTSRILHERAEDGFSIIESHSTRDNRDSNTAVCTIIPPFIEFDMSLEGFGYLFLPSIAPQGTSPLQNTLSCSNPSVTRDATVASGGIGTVERIFPPSHGLTFSSWVYVERFDPVSLTDRGCRPQRVNLLTIIRGIQSVNDRLICLRIFIHPQTHMLVVSTQERLLQPEEATDIDMSGEFVMEEDQISKSGISDASDDTASSTSTCAVFPCGLVNSNSVRWPPGVWRHLAVVFNRAGMIKSSSCAVYLDGQLIGVKRLSYIGNSSMCSGFLGRQTMPSSVCAVIGTLAADRRPSLLTWRQGPLHLIDEPLTASKIDCIARLGPNYVGSFQSPPSLCSYSTLVPARLPHPLFSEEKLVFGIYASTLSVMTLARIKKVFNLVDAKAIGKQFYLSPKENATPIRLLHNSAVHLNGPARPLGAALVGYQGIRAFTPNPVIRQLNRVGGGCGGMRVGLALVAMARDVETLYAATKVVCTLINTSPMAAYEMRTTRGYQLFAMLLRKKRHLLTTRILDSILTLTMNIDQNPDAECCNEDCCILDHPVFEDLVCDLDLWRVQRERSVPSESIESAKKSDVDGFSLAPIQIEDDYRLIVNLLSNLTEQFSASVNQSKGTSAIAKDTHRSSIISDIHPLWDVVFDRIFYLLLDVHMIEEPPLSGTAALSVTSPAQPNPPAERVIIGHAALMDATTNFIFSHLCYSASRRHILSIGQLMAWTSPAPDVDESVIKLEGGSSCEEFQASGPAGCRRQLVMLRNACLRVFLKLVTESTLANGRMANEIITTLGFDWMQLFLRPGIHPSSVVLAFHLLTLIILNPSYYVVSSGPLDDWTDEFRTVHSRKNSKASLVHNKSVDASALLPLETDGVNAYRIGCPAGRWLLGCESLLKRQHGLLLGTIGRDRKRTPSRCVTAIKEFHLTACQQPGFAILKAVLPHHSNIPQLFYLLTALLLQIPVRAIPPDFQLEFDSLYSLLSHTDDISAFGLASTQQPQTENRETADVHPLLTPGISGFVTNLLSGAGLSVSGFHPRRAHISSTSPGLPSLFDSDVPSSQPQLVPSSCPEAAALLLLFIRSLLSHSAGDATSSHLSGVGQQINNVQSINDCCEASVRFLTFVYHSYPSLRPTFMSVGFIQELVKLLSYVPVSTLAESVTSSTPDSPLSRPVQRAALELLKTVVTESFFLPPSFHKPIHMVDVVLEYSLDHRGWKPHDEAQTQIICELMDHFILTDLLTDPTARVPAGGDSSFVLMHILYFCTRVVDTLWQGYFIGDTSKLVDFLFHLIEQWPQNSKGPTSSRSNIECLFRSLNRAVLYQLSRPILSPADQAQLFQMFEKLKSVTIDLSPNDKSSLFSVDTCSDVQLCDHKCLLIFAPVNADPEFPGCLIHLFMQLIRFEAESAATRSISSTSELVTINFTDLSTVEQGVDEIAMKTEPVPSLSYYRTAFCEEEVEIDEESPMISSMELRKAHTVSTAVVGHMLERSTTTSHRTIVEKVTELWAELYLSKKPLIALLVPDTPLVSGLSVPSLMDWAPVLESPCLLLWAHYVDSEASGKGGIDSATLWGRIPGPPISLDSFSNKSENPPTSKIGSSNISGSHPSWRLSRIPNNMFRFVPSSASTFANQTSCSPPLTAPSSSSPSSVLSSHADSHVTVDQAVREALDKYVPVQLSYMRDLLDNKLKAYHRNVSFIQRQLEIQWEATELELTRERGLWGPASADLLARWKLDPTEGPCRMRKRMMPNLLFYSQYPYRPSNIIGSGLSPEPSACTIKPKFPRSLHSRLHFLNYQSRSILRDDWGPLTPWLPFLSKQTVILSSSAQLDVKLDGAAAMEGHQEHPSSISETTTSTTDTIEQSLQRTACLLRPSDKSSSCDQSVLTADDIDEMITPDVIELEHDKQISDDVADPFSEADLTGVASPNPSSDAAQPPSVECDASAAGGTYASVVIDDRDHLTGHGAILRLLEPGERPTVMYRCARVFGLDVYEGLLLFGRAHFYFVDGYTLINTREIVDIDLLPADVLHEPVVPCSPSSWNANTLPRSDTRRKSNQADLWSTGAFSQTSGKQYFKFPYENIQDVHKRRYLLQPIALEVFNADGRNFLLVFSKGLQSKVYQRFQDVAALLSASQSLLNQKSLLGSLLGEKTITDRWVHGELNNFQYLMYLNTLAGRSYNDFMQYPVFPWVLADYDSEELDLSCPETFRDFSKPMGAQTAHRFGQFMRRFREWDDPAGETPPYHYGTHYSSAMIVASYLVRMEPFTQQFLRLQGGHFDLPDRMFHSVKDAWLSASQHNMADVRELIPEFFYLPDFLMNANRFDLGIRQNGEEVNHVSLPPWAKGDPREFIRVHREALESEYVSAHLHEWIDLIFGYKQQGDAAVQACNVFHHLFYEGNVDIYSIDDPLKRSAAIGFINNFGQIPKQLFRKPHPTRRVDKRQGAVQHWDKLFYRNIEILSPNLQPVKELSHAIGQIVQIDPQLAQGGSNAIPVVSDVSALTTGAHTHASQGRPFSEYHYGLSTASFGHSGLSGSVVGFGPVVAVEQHKCLLPPEHTLFIAWGFTDGSLRLGHVFDTTERAKCVFEMVDQEEILCCAAPTKRTLITAGVSTVVRVWKIQSYDATKLGGENATVQNTSAGASSVPSSSSFTNGCRLRLCADLCGHTEAVTCLSASSSFNLIVSGSRDQTCILWDLTRLSYLRQLSGHAAPVAAVCINEANGDIASCAGSHLYLWNCNGEPVASVDTTSERNKQIFCVCMTTLYEWDSKNVILTGGSDGVVRMWGLDYVQQFDRSVSDSNGNIHVSVTQSNHSIGESSDVLRRNIRFARSRSEQAGFTISNNSQLTQATLVNGADAKSRWVRQLRLRGELTMHTAYSRSDNSQPAAITALAVSRDHRSVLVGDAVGRVHSWSIPPSNARGSVADQGMRDEGAVQCMTDGCDVKFSLTERRHRCRNCNKVFCSKCTRFEIEIYRLRLFKPVRVCHTCFNVLRIIQAPKSEKPLVNNAADSFQ